MSKLTAKLFLLATLLFFTNRTIAQNDDCTNAISINIPAGGFGLGTFYSDTNSITSATIQAGETFAPAILVAGQNQKSIWYKFSIPTHRSVRVTLAQSGSVITAGDVGFAVYKVNACLPAGTDISTKLTPIGVFGSTLHPCVDPGEYMVQVSGKNAANGSVFLILDIATSAAAYDKQTTAYDFGVIGGTNYIKYIDYTVDCQSIEDATEVCTSLSNYTAYKKSSWHTFTTPAYFDYIGILLSNSGPPYYFNGSTADETFGYNLYQGNAQVLPFSSLVLVDGCDSLMSNGYSAAIKTYKCDALQPNTTYTIQLFFKENFISNIRLGLTYQGFAPTQAPEPVSTLMPATNKLGTLPASPAGIVTTVTDQLGCNSKHSLHPCDPTLPAGGIQYNGLTYDLSTYFTFTLASTARISLLASDVNPPYQFYSYPLLMRLFSQDVTASCSGLDTTSLFAPPFLSNIGFTLDCVPPGTYTLQVSGRDTPPAVNYYNYSHVTYGNYELGLRGDLGKKFYLNINVANRNPTNHYNLGVAGAFDTTNLISGVMQALVPGIVYQSETDTFGCANTVLPVDTTCAPGNFKAIYREFNVADSGIVTLTNDYYVYHKLYFGDADALSTAQNVHNYPERITGLIPQSICMPSYECGGQKVCVVPGTYTHVAFADDTRIGYSSQPTFRFDTLTTRHDSPAKAENMGTVTPGGPTVVSSVDYFSCTDNAIPINGYMPCMISGDTATKAIYREFYLSAASTLSIGGYEYNGCGYYYGPVKTLFFGRASAGISGLTPVPSAFLCFQNATTNNTCDVYPAGWYTVVSYGSGPTYADPFQNINQYGYGSYIARSSQLGITATPACPGPQYNRPYKSSFDTLTGQPYLIQWANRAGHTSAYPKTDTTFKLNIENFNCTVDTPFVAFALPDCAPGVTKAAFYVFRTTQESYIQIDTKGFWGAVYAGDARTDSASFNQATLIQPCLRSNGFIQLCKLPPGTYTLTVLADNTSNCVSVEPTIYIDKTGTSRFDFANNAYDFGVIPPDSTYYSGKVGDVNPIDPGRPASSDIIYCSTGAAVTDPAEVSCNTEYNPWIYTDSTYLENQNNEYQIPRRNLWYTFVVKEGGTVRVRVKGKTPGKTYEPRYAIYRSDVNGTIPFSTVVSTGAVDSTAAQGLTYIEKNFPYCYYYYFGYTDVSFYRNTCNPVPERYYIVVENPSNYPYEIGHTAPNNQVDVSVLVDSVNSILPLFDHYSQASSLGTALTPGTYTGQVDNYSCATGVPADPTWGYGSCARTLWYKFDVAVTGHVRFNAYINNQPFYQNYYIQLFRQIIPGDSTVAGLQLINANNDAFYDPATAQYWGQQCVSPGTYYILLTGCNALNEFVYPVIKIVEQAGDFCSAPVIAPLNGAGVNVSTVTVNCHTIGTDYGEFNPTLTCPAGTPTDTYKTSWFRIDITGTDTLDVTTYLTENTNAFSTDIKYRLMNGNCGAMQERSCVQDAQTQDTYKCLAPGSYFVQVFTPQFKNGVPVTGDISLNLSSVVHADSCAPIPPCLANANFQTQFDCTTEEAVTFINYSTFGSAITYNWDFGYNGQTSAAVSPQFTYPALAAAQTYTVTMTMNNSSCSVGGSVIYSAPVTIPGRPAVNLGRDTSLCAPGSSLSLDATTWSGATYAWENGSTSPTRTITASGLYWITVTYNGCMKRDSIRVDISPITPYNQTKILCGNDSALLSSVRNVGETYQWNTGSVAGSIYASTAGLYINNLIWRGCLIKDTFNVSNMIRPFSHDDTTRCFPFQTFALNAAVPGAQSYQWQNGSTSPSYTVTAPGQYWVNVNFGTCALRDTIQVNVSAAPLVINTSASICAGQNYTLPWGTIVNTAGLHYDTIPSVSGCDSIRRVVNLSVKNVNTISTNAALCAGGTYTLPWGQVISTAGIYRDTIHYVSGCDSIRRIVNVIANNASATITNAVICQGQSYTLPGGASVNTSGTYKDTLHYVSGCDSILRTVNLLIQSFASQTSNATMCPGQNITLPWGAVVNTPGTYRDTLHYASGCDSVRKTVVLSVQNFSSTNTNANICSGQTYILPWGAVVSSAGTYRDTLHYVSGCDSIRRTVNLTVQTAVASVINANICSGSSYTLPWGQVVSVAGTYQDTLHYATGCDSIRRTVNLTQQNFTTNVSNITICSGQSYTLPWGGNVSVSGAYHDTLHYATGCDSIRRTVNLVVQNFTNTSASPAICAGQTYTLPWGVVVNTSGIYNDTLHYTSGCDSIRRTVNLIVQQVAATSVNANICAGQTYTLPWGSVVNTAGIYNDTLYYATGCDSIRRSVNLTVQNFSTQVSNANICTGQSYTLPWGAIATTSGIYHDTLHYATGCDSIRRTVNLIVQNFITTNTSTIICSGQSYTLPWGAVVNTAGTYYDTLHYATGCDSIRRTVNIAVQSPVTIQSSAVICAGQNYTLPWGGTVNTSGVYSDTLHYATGCDSVRRSVSLTVQAAGVSVINATICTGRVYTLPSGAIVNTSGTFKDTLHFASGCDSLYRIVNLAVTPAAVSTVSASICADQQYTLPWGTLVNTTGMYVDTVTTSAGCDSLVRTVNLVVHPLPLFSISKSNDVNCILGTTTLSVNAGTSWQWSPAASLSDPTIRNPVASPTANTLYSVVVTDANGCKATSSLLVRFELGSSEKYLVPNSFTPNGDNLNDCFGVPHWGRVNSFSLVVYNRYGYPVFKTTDPSECWDGSWKGVQQNTGAFVYIITANGVCGPVTRKGTLMLIR